ncbi:MAG: Hint domain-containing protein [Rhodobacter sp.]|nr:Hint domain-containing protein [Rhodobacter sp.]
MSWIALGDGRRPLRKPGTGPDVPALLTSGSLVIEAQFHAADMAPQCVLRMRRSNDWQRLMQVTLHADGAVLVEHRQGPAVSYANLRIARPGLEDALRITYSWDAPMRVGLLTVENLETGALDQVDFDDPHPLPIDDAAALVSSDGETWADPTVVLVGVSDQIEPVGLPAGIVEGALVETASGPRRIETLQPGDLVVTEGRGYAPVRRVIHRELPAAGRFRPVTLYAPFFGLNRDLTVAQDHRLMIRGADAEYLFGADGVLVEARHLARTAAAPVRDRQATVAYVQVVLDHHDCLMVSGAWVESLYLGDRGKDPARLASAALVDCAPGELPLHGTVASPLLKSYEAMVLVSALSA